MRTRQFIIALCLVSGIASGSATPAQAGVNLHIDIGVPPPARRYEPVPRPRAGFVWVEGYWAWTGRRHEWIGGHWEAARPGFVYHRPLWIHERDRWHFREGAWEPDRKGGNHRDNRHWHDRKGPDRFHHNRDRGHDRGRH